MNQRKMNIRDLFYFVGYSIFFSVDRVKDKFLQGEGIMIIMLQGSQKRREMNKTFTYCISHNRMVYYIAVQNSRVCRRPRLIPN